MDILNKGIATSATQLSVLDNIITIERGTFRADNSHRINPDWRVSNPEGNELVLVLYESFEHYLKTRKNKPLKRISKAYRDAMSSVVASASHSMNRGYPVRYGRSSADSAAIRECIDYLAAEGLILSVKGRANQWQENTSWFVPTGDFMLELERSKIRIGLAKGTQYLILRNDKKESIPYKKNTRITQQLSRSVSAYNDTWLTHVVTLDGNHMVPFCVRMFNESFLYGGRFYRATHMTEPKKNRKRILIDGEETIEPDFKALHYSLLYAMEGIELTGDPYMLEGYGRDGRDTIKLVSLVLLNSENIAAFKRNVTKSGNPAVKATIAAYETEYADYLEKTRNGEAAKEPYKPMEHEGFICGKDEHGRPAYLPDNIKGADVLEAIINRHPLISHYFGAEKIGLKLQRMDSDIMAACLGALSSMDIPVLPVHDSIRCKVSDLEITARIMSKSYEKITGFRPQIDW